MIAEVSKLRNETAKSPPDSRKGFWGNPMAGSAGDREAYDSFARSAWETSLTPGVPSISRTLTRFLK
jgi:hypothetical protein